MDNKMTVCILAQGFGRSLLHMDVEFQRLVAKFGPFGLFLYLKPLCAGNDSNKCRRGCQSPNDSRSKHQKNILLSLGCSMWPPMGDAAIVEGNLLV